MNGSVDLDFSRQEHTVDVAVVRREADAEVVVVQ